MNKFCRHLSNGLVYNNNTTTFTISPCCFFAKENEVDPDKDLSMQLLTHRTSWLDSEVSVTCKICIDAERRGAHSYRLASFDIINGVENKLEFLTVAINKKCNLACPSCDSQSSSFWYQSNIKNKVPQPRQIHQLHQEDRQGVITDKFISLLSDQDLTALTYIKFGGGEPLMTDTHKKVMSLIPDPSKVTIQYTSNFSVMPTQSTLKMWEKFKLVKWVASIDGVKEQFSFLRWPYRWEKLEIFTDNAIRKVPSNVMFGVEHTLNPLNIFYFDQFESWFDNHLASNRCGDQSDFNIHLCNGVIGLEHTPPELRKKIKNKYGENHQVSMALDQKPYSGSTTGLVHYLDQLDVQRKINWRRLFPEVQEFFNA
jgi:hypothetical protein